MTETPPTSANAAQWMRQARGGTRWALLAQVASQVTSLGVFAILCRWIAPSDFGVFNTALLIVTLPRMMVLVGMNAATIQRQRLEASEQSTLFWLNMLLSLFCAGLALSVGWMVGLLSDSQRLFPVTAMLSGTTVVAALGASHLALLDRALRVERSATIRWASQACASIVAVVLALREASITALVAQQYVELGLLAALAWTAERWRPGRWGGLAALGPALHLGRHVALTNLIFYVAQNSDKLLLYLLIGATAIGESAIGMYALAYNFMMKPVYLVSTSVSSVMLPALSRCVDRPAAYRELVVHFFRFSAAVLLPSGIGLMMVADDAMRVQAGEGWSQAGTLLALFAPAVLVHGLFNITGSVLTSAGRSAWLVRASLIVALLQLQSYAAGYWLGNQALVPPWGSVYGVAASYSFALVVVIFIPYLAVSLAQVGVPLSAVMRPLVPLLLASSGMGIVVWGLRRWLAVWPWWTEWSALGRLVVLVSVGVAVYSMLARRELRQLLRG